jgi:hypothetical protein
VARKAAQPLVRQVYKTKQREEVQKMEVDPERTTSQDIIQIGSMDVPIAEDGKRLIVLNNKVMTSTPKVASNNNEAGGSSSNSKYFLPRWCPPGLTRTQRRKLQRLRFQEKREKELEKQRDEVFNQYRPMVPQGKEWRVKTISEPAPSDRWKSQSDWSHRSDRWSSTVRPMTQGCRSVFLLRFPWFVMTRPHRILHQKMMRSLLITVLHLST